ncbi:hypothetical protein CPARA_1gp101 (nucleomorph) [Cryptomonas paramecium]|uniref:Uncharacterized protein n=1 Tax=Cryptomonas paramaecium TaxID=2898 RepID=F2HHG3_9CRYP|nr:hypothetical protein CPARA_1gp101 [Cryptomonas paramecium]AEA38759.1 hypothetical protein CPARA_1gp101 [Cryptomonas paramecium]
MRTKSTLYKLTTNFLDIYKIEKKKFSSINFQYDSFSKMIDIKYNIKILIKTLLNFFSTIKKKNTMLMLFHQNVKINKLLTLLKKPLYIFFFTKKMNCLRYSFLLNFLTKIYSGNFVLLFKYHLNLSKKFSRIKLLLLNDLLYTNIHEIEIFNLFQKEGKQVDNFFLLKRFRGLICRLISNAQFFFFLSLKKFLFENIVSGFQKTDLTQFTGLSIFLYFKFKLNLYLSKFKYRKVKKKFIMKENLISIFQKKNSLIKQMKNFQTVALYFFTYRYSFFLFWIFYLF